MTGRRQPYAWVCDGCGHLLSRHMCSTRVVNADPTDDRYGCLDCECVVGRGSPAYGIWTEAEFEAWLGPKWPSESAT